MAKKDSFTQEKANEVFEAAALATYKKFGFNPAVILGFEMSPASDLYISPKLPGSKDWYFLKDPMGEEALVYNAKTQEVLLVESDESWSEKTQKQFCKISAADQKTWQELTGKALPGTKAVAAKAKPAAKKKTAAKKPAAKKKVAKKKTTKKK